MLQAVSLAITISDKEREKRHLTRTSALPHSAAVSRRFLRLFCAWLRLGFTRRPAHRAPCRAHMHRAQRTLRPLRARTGDLAPSRTPISMCVSDVCVMVCVCKVHRICAQGISEFVSCVSRGINHHKSVRRTRDQYITGGTGHGRVAWHTHDTRHTHLRDTMPH